MKKLFLLMMLLSISAKSFAAGMATHMVITEVALDKISDPELKALLKANRDAVLTGSIFPDTGNGYDYSLFAKKEQNYSRFTHQPEFTEAYLAEIKADCRAPFNDCQALVAHFMGAEAHNMEDGIFHTLFNDERERMDPLAKETSLDQSGDFILINWYRWCRNLPEYYVPADEVAEIFQKLGKDYKKTTIITGNQIHQAALAGECLLAPFEKAGLEKKLPWEIKNIYTAPGGIDYTAGIVADYWEALWLRLNGKDGQLALLNAVYPASGAEAIFPDTGIYLMFNQPVLTKTLNSSSIILTGPDQGAVNGIVRNQNKNRSELTIFSEFIPESPLQPATTYAVVLTTDIADPAGKSLSQNYSWKFATLK